MAFAIIFNAFLKKSHCTISPFAYYSLILLSIVLPLSFS